MTLDHRLSIALAVGVALTVVGIAHFAQGDFALASFFPIGYALWMGRMDKDGWHSDAIPLVAGWALAGSLLGWMGTWFFGSVNVVPFDDVGAGLGVVVALTAMGMPHPSWWNWPLLVFGVPECPERFARRALAEVLDAMPHLVDPKLRAEAAQTPLWLFASKGGHIMDGSHLPNPIGPWALVFERPVEGRFVKAKWDGIPFALNREKDEQAIAQAIIDRRLAMLGARGLAWQSLIGRPAWRKIGLMPPALDATAHARIAWQHGLKD